MTLPNRPNYIVERKAEGGEYAYQKVQQELPPHSSYSQIAPNGFPFQAPPIHEHKQHQQQQQQQDMKSSTVDLTSPHEQDVALRSTSLMGKNSIMTASNSNNNTNTLLPSSNGANPPNSSYDAYRTTSVERLSQEDIQEKKNYVQKHRLQAHMLQIVEYCRTEGIIPNLPPNLYTPSPPTDYSLNEFLETQGIECPEDDAGVTKEDDEFSFKLLQLKNAYNEELEKLNRVCQEFVGKLPTSGWLPTTSWN